MNSLSPDMARLLVTQRLDEAEQRRLRRAARAARADRATRSTASVNRAAEGAPRVPQQRRGGGLLARFVPGTGVRADAG